MLKKANQKQVDLLFKRVQDLTENVEENVKNMLIGKFSYLSNKTRFLSLIISLT